jgi:hypothetical protein
MVNTSQFDPIANRIAYLYWTQGREAALQERDRVTVRRMQST